MAMPLCPLGSNRLTPLPVCGIQLNPGARQRKSNSSCDAPCAGNKQQVCGGVDRLTLFHNPASSGPVPNQGIKDWPYLGCFTEGTQNRRALANQAPLDASTMTAATCVKHCESEGYHLAGTEYASQCCQYCSMSSSWIITFLFREGILLLTFW